MAWYKMPCVVRLTLGWPSETALWPCLVGIILGLWLGGTTLWPCLVGLTLKLWPSGTRFVDSHEMSYYAILTLGWPDGTRLVALYEIHCYAGPMPGWPGRFPPCDLT